MGGERRFVVGEGVLDVIVTLAMIVNVIFTNYKDGPSSGGAASNSNPSSKATRCTVVLGPLSGSF